MTRDDIIRMAREAGLDGFGTPLGAIERFHALAVAAEREACIKTCQMIVADNEYAYADECVAAIRARSKT